MKKKLESLTTNSDAVTVNSDVTPTFCTFYNRDEVDQIKETLRKETKDQIIELRADILDREMKAHCLVEGLRHKLEEQTAKFNYYVRYKTLEPVLVYDKKMKALMLHRLVNCRDMTYYVSRRKHGKIIDENDLEICIKVGRNIYTIHKLERYTY